jgi:membrane dipeptidase
VEEQVVSTAATLGARPSSSLHTDAALGALHQVDLTIDAHVDVTWQMTKRGGFSLSEEGYSQVNVPAMRRGGLSSVVCALYLSDRWQDRYQDRCFAHLNDQVLWLQRSPDVVLIQREREVIRGKVPIFLALEGGRLLRGSIADLEYWVDRGVKYVTLVHNRSSELADSATDVPRHNGLSALGRTMVTEMKRRGCIVDLSHSTDRVVEQVASGGGPVMASHSGCRWLVPHPRNLSPRLVKLIVACGGVVCVPLAKAFVGSLRGAINHVREICQLTGTDQAVGIGSDFDGAHIVEGISVDKWVEVLGNNLSDAGFNDRSVASILGHNLQRQLLGG